MTATKKTSGPIKIIIADDHPIFRQGLKHTFSETTDIKVVGEVENGDDLLDQLTKSGANLILLDISMPGKSSLEVLKILRTLHSEIPVLMLSVYPEDQYAVRFIRTGASGYMTKETPSKELIEAIRKISLGGKYASPHITEKLAFEFSNTDKHPHETLSDREFQVFNMISNGYSLTEIGEKLSLSVKTISTYRTRILEKMRMKKNAEIIHYAIQYNLT
jgi:two-component system invasion response regulator UvrY